MTNRTTLLGLLAVGLLAAACSKQAPAPAPATDKEAAPPVASQNEPVAPAHDRTSVAKELMTYIATTPQCQTYIDRLEAIANTPADQPVPSEPSAIFGEAYKADCAKKKQ
jgi:hypothetical protein